MDTIKKQNNKNGISFLICQRSALNQDRNIEGIKK